MFINENKDRKKSVKKVLFKLIYSQLWEMIESSREHLWIGMTDREQEGVFRYLNGQIVNAQIGQGETLLYYFINGQPDNYENKQDCAVVLPEVLQLDDIPCSDVRFGLCEIKRYR